MYSIYDQYGEEGLKGSGQQFHDPFDIFSQFGFGGRGGRDQNKRGPEIRLPLNVTLNELYNGHTFEVDINKQIICPICRGSGAKNANDVKTCTSCQGRGIKIIRQMIAPGMYQQMQQVCEVCSGKGKVVKSKCTSCHGEKVKRGSSLFTVTIEKGMNQGSHLRYEGEGDQSPDHSAGDVVFDLNIVPHSLFDRKGDHLYVTETISLKEALLGFQHKLLHLDGRMIEISRKDVTTQPGTRLIFSI